MKMTVLGWSNTMDLIHFKYIRYDTKVQMLSGATASLTWNNAVWMRRDWLAVAGRCYAKWPYLGNVGARFAVQLRQGARAKLMVNGSSLMLA